MESKESVRLVLTGDIFMGGDFLPKCYENNYNPFDGLKKLIRPDDIVISNLETTFYHGYQRPFRAPLLWSPPESIRFLEYLKLDVACLANNHILDYGYKSMLRTKKLLENHQIKCFGTGLNLDDSLKPAIIKRNNISYGFIGFTSKAYNVNALISGWNRPGSPPMRVNLILRQIKVLKKHCNFVCVCLHWGHEYTNVPTQQQRIIAEKIIEGGADLIMGTHPHVIQGYEIIKGKPVFYSLGNFFFPEFEDLSGNRHIWKKGCEYSMVIFLDGFNNKLEIEVLPVKTQDGKLIILNGEEKNEYFLHLNAYNEAIKQGNKSEFFLNTKKKLEKNRIVFLKNRPKQFLRKSLYFLSLFKMFRFLEGVRHKFAKKDIQ